MVKFKREDFFFSDEKSLKAKKKRELFRTLNCTNMFYRFNLNWGKYCRQARNRIIETYKSIVYFKGGFIFEMESTHSNNCCHSLLANDKNYFR